MYKVREILPLCTCTLQKVLEMPRWREGEKQVTGLSCASTLEGAVAPRFPPPEQIVFIGDGASSSAVAIATEGRRGRREGRVSLALRSLVFLCLTEGVRCGRLRGVGGGSAFEAAEKTLEVPLH